MIFAVSLCTSVNDTNLNLSPVCTTSTNATYSLFKYNLATSRIVELIKPSCQANTGAQKLFYFNNSLNVPLNLNNAHLDMHFHERYTGFSS